MHGILFAPFAVLLELDLLGHELLILAGPIVNTLTVPAGELYELVLRHGEEYTPLPSNRQLSPGSEFEVVANVVPDHAGL